MLNIYLCMYRRYIYISERESTFAVVGYFMSRLWVLEEKRGCFNLDIWKVLRGV